jgi:hypothetical protein
MGGLRVIVCGGRDYMDWDAGFAALDKIHAETPIEFVFHGNARGADSIASAWASEPMRARRGVRNCPCPAQWAKHGKSAGPKRNQAMLGNGIDLVIAFPGGRGTADMVRRARAAGVSVVEPMSPTPKSPLSNDGSAG